ncbi:LamG domain-containing protein [bacterium]|nr:LamG domain-containing protein [bacterium]
MFKKISMSIIVCLSVLACSVLQADMLKFEEGKGDRTKSTSGDLEFEISGAEWIQGKEGLGLKFDGIDDYACLISPGEPEHKKGIAVSAWVYPASVTGQTHVIVTKVSEYALSILGGKVLCSVYINKKEYRITGKVRLSPNRWYHLAFEYIAEKGEMTLYINREIDTVMVLEGVETPAIIDINRYLLTIGTYKYSLEVKPANCFEGIIDEVEISEQLNLQEAVMKDKYNCWEEIEKKFTVEKNCFINIDNNISTLNNKRLGVVLEKSGLNCNITGLWDIEKKHNFAGFPLELKNLWALELLDRNGNFSLFEEITTGTFEWSSEKNKDYAKILLRWKDINVYKDKGHFNIDVEIKIPYENPFCYWRINLDNHLEKNAIVRVVFPRFNLCRKIGKDSYDDYLVYTKGPGRLIRDPTNELQILPDTPAYPSWNQAMQFTLFYDENITGLYMGAHDPQNLQKTLRWDKLSSKVFSYELINFPEDIDIAGNDYKMDYDAVVGIFDGNWYDGAMIYKDWALNQRWVKAGPIYKRDDIPKWFKDLGLWIVGGLSYNPDIKEIKKKDYLRLTKEELYEYKGSVDVELTVNDIKKMSDYFQTSLCLWTSWGWSTGWYFPQFYMRRNIPECVSSLHNIGVYWNPYLDFRRLTKGLSLWEKFGKYSTINRFGEPNSSALRGEADGLMCPYAKEWRDVCISQLMELVEKAKIDGCYIDELASSISQLCYSRGHGHKPGGGGYWTEGVRAFLREIRTEARKVNPDFIMSGESFCEIGMDLLDAHLMIVSDHQQDIPLVMAVYHPFAICYGRNFGYFTDKSYNKKGRDYK